MNIIDKNGVWLINIGAFALVDTTTKIHTRYEPGEATKATHTEWAKAQPTLQRCADPSTDPNEKELAKLDTQNQADAEARAAAEQAAEKAQALARGEAIVASLAVATAEAPAAAEAPAEDSKK